MSKEESTINQYTIYLVNQNKDTELFWVFLSKPQIETTDDNLKVFANSSTSLSVEGHSIDSNCFTIPVQYVIGAGASNEALDLDVEIKANAERNTQLGDVWKVEYFDAPPLRGPGVPRKPSDFKEKGSTIKMEASPFEAERNENGNHWYASMSFGIRTKQGFLGVTWPPGPNKTYTITPKLSFFITVGSHESYKLADVTAVATESQEVDVSSDFDINLQCTLVYCSNGKWKHYQGQPKGEDISANQNLREEFLA